MSTGKLVSTDAVPPRPVTIADALALAAFIGQSIPLERRGEATGAINFFLMFVGEYHAADRAGNRAERDRREKQVLDFCSAARVKAEEITGKAFIAAANGSLTESSPDAVHEGPTVTVTSVSAPAPFHKGATPIPANDAGSTGREQSVCAAVSDGVQADEQFEHAGVGDNVAWGSEDENVDPHPASGAATVELPTLDTATPAAALPRLEHLSRRQRDRYREIVGEAVRDDERFPRFDIELEVLTVEEREQFAQLDRAGKAVGFPHRERITSPEEFTPQRLEVYLKLIERAQAEVPDREETAGRPSGAADAAPGPGALAPSAPQLSQDQEATPTAVSALDELIARYGTRAGKASNDAGPSASGPSSPLSPALPLAAPLVRESIAVPVVPASVSIPSWGLLPPGLIPRTQIPANFLANSAAASNPWGARGAGKDLVGRTQMTPPEGNPVPAPSTDPTPVSTVEPAREQEPASGPSTPVAPTNAAAGPFAPGLEYVLAFDSDTGASPPPWVFDAPVHPLNAAFPRLDDRGLDQLGRSVELRKQQHPIVFWVDERGQVHLVDGENRRQAIRRLNRIPSLVLVRGPERAVEDYIWAANSDRRDMSPGQRAMTGAKIVHGKLNASRDRQRANLCVGKTPSKSRAGTGTRSGDELADEHHQRARDEVAEALRVSPSLIQRGLRVLTQGVPRLAELASAGTLPVSVAARVAKLSPELQIRVLEAAQGDSPLAVAVKKALGTIPGPNPKEVQGAEDGEDEVPDADASPGACRDDGQGNGRKPPPRDAVGSDDDGVAPNGDRRPPLAKAKRTQPATGTDNADGERNAGASEVGRVPDSDSPAEIARQQEIALATFVTDLRMSADAWTAEDPDGLADQIERNRRWADALEAVLHGASRHAFGFVAAGTADLSTASPPNNA
jgi:hypothetical protein